MDEHGNEEASQDSLRPRRPRLVKSILIADGDERVARLFAEVFASDDWRVTRHSDGHRAIVVATVTKCVERRRHQDT